MLNRLLASVFFFSVLMGCDTEDDQSALPIPIDANTSTTSDNASHRNTAAQEESMPIADSPPITANAVADEPVTPPAASGKEEADQSISEQTTSQGSAAVPFAKFVESLLHVVTVKVSLTEGAITVDTPTVDPASQVYFEVHNETKTSRHFVVVETGFPADKLPVLDGRVRYFTYFDEPHKLVIRHGGGWSRQSDRDSTVESGSHVPEPGVKIPAGETVVYKGASLFDGSRFTSGTAFVIFCNDPGHYEQGEYAGIIIK